jgi:hypothetical protein
VRIVNVELNRSEEVLDTRGCGITAIDEVLVPTSNDHLIIHGGGERGERERERGEREHTLRNETQILSLLSFQLPAKFYCSYIVRRALYGM